MAFYLNLEKLGKPEGCVMLWASMSRLSDVLMTEFKVACVAGYYFAPIHIPFLLPPYPLPLSTPATQAKFMVVSGRKDGVDLFFIYRYVVIFVARFG